MAKKYDKGKLIAEYKTGAYTQRELASRYQISVAMVSKLTKSVKKESEQLVNTKINIDHALAHKSEQEVNAINEVVNAEVAKKIERERISGRLDTTIDLAINVATRQLNSKEATMQDVSQFAKAQNDFRVGLGTQDKFAAAQNINIQQNNDNLAERLARARQRKLDRESIVND